MDIFVWIFFIVEAIIGVGSCIAIIVLLFGTLGYKILHKVKDGTSLFN